MVRPVFSVICLYNKESDLNEWLLKGLHSQTRAFELLTVDNTSGQFKSAAEGLNFGGAKAAGEYIIFIHQDVRLTSFDWLDRAEKFLRAIPDLGVAGVAGMLPSSKLTVWQVGTAPVPNRVGLVSSGLEQKGVFGKTDMDGPVSVQTLDEQVLIVPKRIFAALRFDETVCDNWHLYGTDYALSVAALGLKACVLPVPVHHKSLGRLDDGYFRTLRKIFKKHRAVGTIYTTCGSWYTSFFRDCAALLLMAARAQAGKWAGRNTTGWKQSLTLLGFLLRSLRGTGDKA